MKLATAAEAAVPAARERSVVPGISRNVFVLGLVSLFTDVSSEMVYPLTPIFLTSVLGATASVVGLVEGVAEATASLMRVFFGFFSDRLGKGIRTPARDALIAESSLPEIRGRAFGFHASMDTLGAVVGPLLAFGVLSAMSGDLRMVFVLAFIPGVIAGALIRLSPETSDARQAAEAARKAPFAPSQHFLIFVGVSTLFAVGNSSDAFLVLRSGNHDVRQ